MNPTNNHKNKPARFIEDGLDHINIDINGATDLGRFLSIDADYYFTLPKYGSFSSIRALWTYLSTVGHPDNLRHMPIHQLREFARVRDQENKTFNHPELLFVCAYVLADKVKHNPDVVETMIQSGTAPFKSYYKRENGIGTHIHAWWWIDVCYYLRDFLINGEEPTMLQMAVNAQSFEEACVDLVKAPRLGMFQKQEQQNEETQVKRERAPKPAKEKKEKETKKKEVHRREFNEPPTSAYATAAELDINELNTRILGVKDRKQYGEVFQFLNAMKPEELKEFITATNHVTVIPVSLTEEDIGPDDVKHKFIMTFNPETFEFVGLATGEFYNPLIMNDTRETVEVVEDATEQEVGKLVRILAGVPAGVKCRVFSFREEGDLEDEMTKMTPVGLEVIEDHPAFMGTAPIHATAMEETRANETEQQ